MTGWSGILILALLAVTALWRFGGFRGAGLQFLLAAVLVAMAGYAWQGKPWLRGAAKPSQEQSRRPETGFALLRDELLPQFDAASRWLILADSYQRRGQTADAVAVLRSGLRASPRSMTLWIGLGNALVIHSGGTMNAAAEMAYARASALAPVHPAPRFFYGLSLIESGRPEEGEAVWRQLLASAPADAKWRPKVADRLTILEQLRTLRTQQATPVRTE